MVSGIIYITELPEFFQRYRGPVCEPSSRIKQALQKIPSWDRVRLRGSEDWINGILVDRELIFWEPNDREHRIPFAQIAVVAVNRNERFRADFTLTIRYNDERVETFGFARGYIQLTFLGKPQTYTLHTVDRIVVGISNKFI